MLRVRREHDLFGDRLHRGGEIHVALGKRFLGVTRRPAEQIVKPLVGHPEPGAVVEIALVEAEAAVGLQIDQVVEDSLGKARLAIRGEAHHLVFARIDFEPGVVGERGIKQSERVREMDLLDHLSVLPRPMPTEVVAHSPTPSIVSTAASSNGEGKKADAAWLW